MCLINAVVSIYNVLDLHFRSIDSFCKELHYFMSFAFISNVFLAIFITLMCILIVISVLKKLIRNLWIFTLTFVIAFYVRKWWRTFTVQYIYNLLRFFIISGDLLMLLNATTQSLCMNIYVISKHWFQYYRCENITHTCCLPQCFTIIQQESCFYC